MFKAKGFDQGGYEPKLFVLTLKGKRGRSSHTLGTVTVNLVSLDGFAACVPLN